MVRIAMHLLDQTGGISFPIVFRSMAKSWVFSKEVDGGGNTGGANLHGSEIPSWGGIDHPEI
jgi:hypothetical protein